MSLDKKRENPALLEKIQKEGAAFISAYLQKYNAIFKGYNSARQKETVLSPDFIRPADILLVLAENKETIPGISSEVLKSLQDLEYRCLSVEFYNLIHHFGSDYDKNFDEKAETAAKEKYRRALRVIPEKVINERLLTLKSNLMHAKVCCLIGQVKAEEVLKMQRPFSLRDIIEFIESEERDNARVVLSDKTRKAVYALEAFSCWLMYMYSKKEGDRSNYHAKMKAAAFAAQDMTLLDGEVLYELSECEQNGILAWKYFWLALEQRPGFLMASATIDAYKQLAFSPKKSPETAVNTRAEAYLAELEKSLPASLSTPEDQAQLDKFKAAHGDLSVAKELTSKNWPIDSVFISWAHELDARLASLSDQARILEARALSSEISQLKLDIESGKYAEDTVTIQYVVIRKEKAIRQLLLEVGISAGLGYEDRLWIGETLLEELDRDVNIQTYIKAKENLRNVGDIPSSQPRHIVLRNIARSYLYKLDEKINTLPKFKKLKDAILALSTGKMDEVFDAYKTALKEEKQFKHTIRFSFSPLDIITLAENLDDKRVPTQSKISQATKQLAQDLHHALEACGHWYKSREVKDPGEKAKHHTAMIEAGKQIKNLTLLDAQVELQADIIEALDPKVLETMSDSIKQKAARIRTEKFFAQNLNYFEALLRDEKRLIAYFESSDPQSLIPSTPSVIESKNISKERVLQTILAFEARRCWHQYQKTDSSQKEARNSLYSKMLTIADQVSNMRLLGTEICKILYLKHDRALTWNAHQLACLHQLLKSGDLDSMLVDELTHIESILPPILNRSPWEYAHDLKSLSQQYSALPFSLEGIRDFVEKECKESTLSQNTKDHLYVLLARGYYSQRSWTSIFESKMIIAASQVKKPSLLDPKIEEAFLTLDGLSYQNDSEKQLLCDAITTWASRATAIALENHIKGSLSIAEKSYSYLDFSSSSILTDLWNIWSVKMIELVESREKGGEKILTDETRERLYALGAKSICGSLTKPNELAIEWAMRVKNISRLDPGLSLIFFQRVSDVRLKWQYLWHAISAIAIRCRDSSSFEIFMQQAGGVESIKATAIAYLEQCEKELPDEKSGERRAKYISEARHIAHLASLNDVEIRAIAYLNECEKTVAEEKSLSYSLRDNLLKLQTQELTSQQTFDRVRVVQARILEFELADEGVDHRVSHREKIEQYLLEIDDFHHLKPEDILWAGKMLAGISTIKSRVFLQHVARMSPTLEVEKLVLAAKEELSKLDASKEMPTFNQNLREWKKGFAEKGDKFLTEKLDEIEDLFKDEGKLEKYLETLSTPESLKAFELLPLNLIALAESKEEGSGSRVPHAVKERAWDLYHLSVARVCWHEYKKSAGTEAAPSPHADGLWRQSYDRMLKAARSVTKIWLLGWKINEKLLGKDQWIWISLLEWALKSNPENAVRQILDSIEKNSFVKLETIMWHFLHGITKFVEREGGKQVVAPEILDRLYTLKARGFYMIYMNYVEARDSRKLDIVESILRPISKVRDLTIFKQGMFDAFDTGSHRGFNVIHRVVAGARAINLAAEAKAESSVKRLPYPVDSFIQDNLRGIAQMLPPIPSNTDWTPNHELYAKYLNLPVSLRDMIEFLDAQKSAGKELALPDVIKDQLYALEVRYCYIESQYNKHYGADPEAWKIHDRLMRDTALAVTDKSCLDAGILKELGIQISPTSKVESKATPVREAWESDDLFGRDDPDKPEDTGGILSVPEVKQVPLPNISEVQGRMLVGSSLSSSSTTTNSSSTSEPVVLGWIHGSPKKDQFRLNKKVASLNAEADDNSRVGFERDMSYVPPNTDVVKNTR